MRAPILAFSDFKETFQLFTDTSNEGIGAILGQIQDGKEVAIAYAGRDFIAAERSYSTTERETLVVVFGVKKFEPYLYGRKFILHTDHRSLKWLMSISDLLLQQYDFEIKHCPGTANANADALSRRPYAIPLPSISAFDAPGVQVSRVRELQRKDPDLSALTVYLESSKLPDQGGSAQQGLSC